MSKFKKTTAALLTMIMLLSFIPATANAATRGWKKSGKYWTYIMPSGKKAKGWKKINKKWYYFDKKYHMVTGLQKISKKYYYFASNGKMKTGWVKIDKKKYYFDVQGDMLKKKWVDTGTAFYYVDEDGVMVKNTARKIGKDTYCFASDGKKITTKGWCGIKVGTQVNEEGEKEPVYNYYYLDKKGVAYKEGWHKIYDSEGKKYEYWLFDKNCVMIDYSETDPTAAVVS